MHVKKKSLRFAIKMFKFEIRVLRNKYVLNPISSTYTFRTNMQTHKVPSPGNNN